MTTLQTQGVGLWQAQLDLDSDCVGRLGFLLSEEEAGRAGRLLSAANQRRFIAAHGILRRVLGSLLDIAPQRLVFVVDSLGKPCLKNGPPYTSVCFNLSHSHEMMLLGVCPKGCIGVDIENKRTRVDIARLCERFFSPAESRAIQNSSFEAGKDLFYQYWTLKEAYLKATGEGIARVRDIEIQIDASNRYVVIDRGRCVNEHWRILPVSVRPGYAGGVAVAAGTLDSEISRMLPFHFHP